VTVRLALAAALAALAIVVAGCGATLDVDVDVDRDGRGSVGLRLVLDEAAQRALGLSPTEDPEVAAERFSPLLADGGWSGGDGQIAASRDADTGELAMETRKQIESTDELDRVLSYPRRLTGIAPDGATLAALTDLPPTAPLLNALDFRLGDGSGDNPGFDLFARGGVGEIGQETCAGDDIVGFGKRMRDSLEITYRFRLPGGPGSTNADETPAGRTLWIARYGDCPPLSASAGGGSSSTLVNGVILAVLAGFLGLVFGLRALRRRGGHGPRA
jgi:hypothetical protein